MWTLAQIDGWEVLTEIVFTRTENNLYIVLHMLVCHINRGEGGSVSEFAILNVIPMSQILIDNQHLTLFMQFF